MTPLDRESIHFKIARIRKNLKELKRLGKLPYETYSKDILNTATAERLLQVTIEAMLDIGSHIVAEESLGEPLEYRDVFQLLVAAKILPSKKASAFSGMAGLRNRIVHVYDDLDHKQIHRLLRNDLGDVELFLKEIVKYLKKATR